MAIENTIDVINPIVNMSSEDISKIQKQSFIKLKKIASSFINAVNRQYVQTVRKGSLSHLTSGGKVISTPLQYFYAYMRQYDNLTNTIKIYQLKFEEQLNSFLNRKMIMTIVNPEDGEVYFLNNFGTKILYDKAGKNFGRFNASLTKTFIQELQNKQGLQQGMRELFDEGIRRWQPTFQKIIEQMNRNDDNWIYYKKYNNARQYLSNHYSRGNIAEGYMRAVINDSTELENDGEKIVHLYENHIKRDSKPGALQGDVIRMNGQEIFLDEKGLQQHFAIKQGSFSTAKVGQFLAIAQHIKESSFLTPSELKSSLSDIIKKGFNTEKYFKRATKLAEKTIKETIQSTGVKVI